MRTMDKDKDKVDGRKIFPAYLRKKPTRLEWFISRKRKAMEIVESSFTKILSKCDEDLPHEALRDCLILLVFIMENKRYFTDECLINYTITVNGLMMRKPRATSQIDDASASFLQKELMAVF